MPKDIGSESVPCDVAVVGGGFAGVVAALRAAEAGKRVVLIEAGPTLGGTAVFSGGVAHIFSIHSWEEFRQKVPEGDPTFLRVLFDEFPALVSWLNNSGAPGGRPTPMRGVLQEGYRIGSGLVPRQKFEWFAYMRRRLEDLGATVIVGARGQSLITTEHAVVGVRIMQGETPSTIYARSTVLAAGGFQCNPALLVKYLGAGACDVVQRAVDENVGDGLKMGLQAGGHESPRMDTFYGHFLPAPPCKVDWSEPLDPLIMSAYYSEYGIVLNSRGERFVDEGFSEKNGLSANAAIRQPSGGQWVVMDNHVRETFGRYELPWPVIKPSNLRYWRYLRFMRVRRSRFRLEVTIDSVGVSISKGATVIRAESLDQLVQEMQSYGVDATTASQTIQEFDRSASEGRASQLAIPKTVSVYPIRNAPFFAIKVMPGVSMTYGGLAINERTEVLNEDSKAIPGLYAVPGTAGGIHYLHYGGALATCGVFGKIAGDAAAAFTSTARG
jgi:succinate dehydrogenase/fumarate reductase flavoprotein subunit